jgi:hypothetical protein
MQSSLNIQKKKLSEEGVLDAKIGRYRPRATV